MNIAVAPSVSLEGLTIDGVDRLLICAVATEPYNGITTVSNITIDDGSGGDSQNLTQLAGYYNAPPDGLRWSTWYRTGVNVGTNRRVTVNLQDAISTPTFLACVSYAGVDQLVPFANVVTVVAGSAPAALTLSSVRDGSMAWAHLFSSNNGFVPLTGMRLTQATSHMQFSYFVDGIMNLASGSTHEFTWSYAGTSGGQAAMILPSRIQ